MAFTLTWHPSHEPMSEPPAPDDSLADTETWWREWASRCTADGPYRDAVLRSLLVLKALTFAPTGGIAAAGTTSLPEQISGLCNGSYRYCWLRDATFTLQLPDAGCLLTRSSASCHQRILAYSGRWKRSSVSSSRMDSSEGPAGNDYCVARPCATVRLRALLMSASTARTSRRETRPHRRRVAGRTLNYEWFRDLVI